MSSPVGYPQRNAYPMFSSTSQGDVPVGKNGANLIPVMANVTTSSGEVRNFGSLGIEYQINGERLSDDKKAALIRQEFDFRKNGRIGIGKKAAIALRFDDWQDAMKNTLQPLLYSRSLPFSLVLIAQWRTAVAWGAGATPDDLQGWVDRGGEIWCHGQDHLDYIGYDGLRSNIVDAYNGIQTALPMTRIQGFTLPGIVPTNTPEARGDATPYETLNAPEQWYGKVGRLLMSHYGIVETDSGPVQLPVMAQPCRYFYGRAHAGLDFMTLVQAKAALDTSIREKTSLRYMGHAGNFGKPGYMSVADFTAFLDYVVAQRAAGLLEVVMPSSLPYVTSSTDRLDLMYGEGDMVGVANTAPSGWFKLGSAYNIISPTGGHNDLPYFQMDPSGQYIYNPSYIITDATKQGFNGETFMFDGWAKSAGSGNTSARIDIEAGGTTWTVGRTFAVGQTLTRVQFPFTLPRIGPLGQLIATVAIKPSRYGGDAVQWSDMSCYKL